VLLETVLYVIIFQPLLMHYAVNVLHNIYILIKLIVLVHVYLQIYSNKFYKNY